MKERTVRTQPPFPPCRRIKPILLLAVMLSFIIGNLQAATPVSGIVSGTWNSNGSPYILTAECTVPSGAILIVQSGTTVIVGPELSLTVNGRILADGTQERRIVFQGANSSNYWNRIVLNLAHNVTNRFKHCDFRDANTGLYLQLSQVGPPLQTNATEILNCNFSNCREQGIFGISRGLAAYNPNRYWTSHLNPSIRNCQFSSTSNGCTFLITGYSDGTLGSSPGYASPTISGNVFENLAGAALDMRASFPGGNSTPSILNNTFVNVTTGLRVEDPYDANIKNNLFVATSNAVRRSGNLNLDVRYNCFFNNAANFIGYPPTYGQILLENNNGDPCDLSFNIFMDPAFVGNSYFLANGSPCIDAGDSTILDACFPPSLGTAISDMGAYGGTNACAWPLQLVPPTITVQPRLQVTCVGATVTFSVSATGDAPLSYQWRSNGVPINGATAPSYTLANVQANDAADYSVVVSNAAGSDTSDAATLTVAPVCVAIDLFAGLDVTYAVPGATYRIDYVTTLSGLNNWINLTNIVAPASEFRWHDPQPARQERRFYRVIPQ